MVLEWKIVMLGWTMNAVLYPGRPTQAMVRCLLRGRFDSGIFEGVDWSVQNFRSANTGFGGGLPNVTNLIAGKAPPRAFAGFGGEPALALMDAVVAMEKFACS